MFTKWAWKESELRARALPQQHSQIQSTPSSWWLATDCQSSTVEGGCGYFDNNMSRRELLTPLLCFYPSWPEGFNDWATDKMPSSPAPATSTPVTLTFNHVYTLKRMLLYDDDCRPHLIFRWSIFEWAMQTQPANNKWGLKRVLVCCLQAHGDVSNIKSPKFVALTSKKKEAKFNET